MGLLNTTITSFGGSCAQLFHYLGGVADDPLVEPVYTWYSLVFLLPFDILWNFVYIVCFNL